MPFRFEQYENTSAPTLMNLIQRGGEVEANRISANGQAAAAATLAGGRASAQIGETVGNTLANLVRIPGAAKAYDLQQKQDALNTRLVEHKSQELDEHDLMEKVLARTGNDPEAAIKDLELSGHHDAATELRGQLHTTRIQGLQELEQQYKATEQQMKMAQSLLPEPPSDATDPLALDKFRQTYAQALPSLQRMIGPDLSQHLPDPDDPNLADRVAGLHEWGMTAAEKISARRASIAAAQFALMDAKDGRERDAYFTKSLGTYLSTVDNQDEWDQAIANAKHLGANDATIGKFGATYSPEAAADAATLAAVKKTTASPGSLENQIADALKTGDTATVKRLQAAAGMAADARRAAPTSDKPLTAAQQQATKAAAERWKQGELDKLEKEYRAGKNKQPFLDLMTNEYKVPVQISDEELKARKAQIQASYLEQLGVNGAAAPAPAAPKTATLPDLAGLKPGTARRFTEGPFAGQRWTLGPDGKPMQVKSN